MATDEGLRSGRQGHPVVWRSGRLLPISCPIISYATNRLPGTALSDRAATPGRRVLRVVAYILEGFLQPTR